MAAKSRITDSTPPDVSSAAGAGAEDRFATEGAATGVGSFFRIELKNFAKSIISAFPSLNNLSAHARENGGIRAMGYDKAVFMPRRAFLSKKSDSSARSFFHGVRFQVTNFAVVRLEQGHRTGV
jgi:hypothetical protein